ncbi:MAG: hypothetical protein C5B50_02665 [Verrucomicrobia bacterium]|nr:MAG: hypothetical protein C5B50_02665 [Verrucomicrobiota bacterium]
MNTDGHKAAEQPNMDRIIEGQNHFQLEMILSCHDSVSEFARPGRILMDSSAHESSFLRNVENGAASSNTQMASLNPVGMTENSPAFQRWDRYGRPIESRRDDRKWSLFCRPCGTYSAPGHEPSVETLGYYLPSLWDYDEPDGRRPVAFDGLISQPRGQGA